jgi:hypothetical protein
MTQVPDHYNEGASPRPAWRGAIHESDAECDTKTLCSFFHGSENMIKAMPTAPMIQEKNGVVSGQSHQ